ncbi:hypothetical protein [Sphingomonas asaccharolytica]|uniref:hypothetical protein n=1 Tax=Sphingomonas asaccharolytica TaxID=40681 RepID=UPI00083391A7|nr:hypothetical protein [Sphingomonas asaccharolytica]
MTDQTDADMKQLMELPSFRRFLFRSIQTAGLLSHTAYGTNGSDGRDLAFNEGRRSLGFELLREAEAALSEPLRHPLNIMTLVSVLREEAQTSDQERASGRRYDRYGDSDGNDDEQRAG